MHHKNGSELWISHKLNIIRDDDGNNTALVGTIRDITNQKLHDQQLHAIQERFKRLSEAAYEGILIHEKGVIVDANQQFLEMYGCDSVEQIRVTSRGSASCGVH
jgi:PAS domain-containing protein